MIADYRYRGRDIDVDKALSRIGRIKGSPLDANERYLVKEYLKWGRRALGDTGVALRVKSWVAQWQLRLPAFRHNGSAISKSA